MKLSATNRFFQNECLPQGTSFIRKTETVIRDISSVLNEPVEIPVEDTKFRTVPEEPDRVVTLRMY
jgi:hypothetical protein